MLQGKFPKGDFIQSIQRDTGKVLEYLKYLKISSNLDSFMEEV